MPSWERFGERESALSLFQIDAGLDGEGGGRPSFLLTRELAAQGFPVRLVLPKGSPLVAAAEAEGLPVLEARIKGDGEFAGFGLSRAMRKHRCVLAHFHGARAVTVGGAACARAKVPIRIVSRRTAFALPAGPLRQAQVRP